MSTKITSLKKRAKLKSKHENVNYTKALNEIAKEEGYETWQDLNYTYQKFIDIGPEVWSGLLHKARELHKEISDPNQKWEKPTKQHLLDKLIDAQDSIKLAMGIIFTPQQIYDICMSYQKGDEVIVSTLVLAFETEERESFSDMVRDMFPLALHERELLWENPRGKGDQWYEVPNSLLNYRCDYYLNLLWNKAEAAGFKVDPSTLMGSPVERITDLDNISSSSIKKLESERFEKIWECLDRK